MSAKEELTLEELKRLLDYSVVTGEFYWKINRGKIKIGMKAGWKVSKTPSYKICRIIIDNKYYQAHQLAWFYITGEWPKEHIDHENGNPLCNAWHNLRDVTHRQNQQNRKTHRMGKLPGVVYHRDKERKKPWYAHFGNNNKIIHLGAYTTEQEAHNVYRAVLTLMGEKSLTDPIIFEDIPKEAYQKLVEFIDELEKF